MTREELEQATDETRQQIYRVKAQLDQVADPREEKRLLAKLKELQVKQMWFMDQLKVW